MSNKAEIIEFVAQEYGLPRTQVERVVSTVLGCIIYDTRIEGCTIRNFGRFQVTTRAARTGKNPKTGEPVEIPERKRVKFTPAKLFREAVQ